jgi:4-hydroxy-2-oxovalerate aldolase
MLKIPSPISINSKRIFWWNIIKSMLTIVENTLRDGSYVIDFQFDKSQTADITKGLAHLGFEFIEVGHGLGLGAWNKPETGLAKESDEAYIRAAKLAAPKAKIGVFFIPGIGTKDDISRAIDSGIDFIRIGNNIDTFERMHNYAEYAKSKGLWVAVNLMKSYGAKSYEFEKISREIDRWALADAIYLIDSAGCMMPNEVFEYIDRTKEKVSASLGFHGHNNLSFALANTLQAIKAGATYVDSCVRGMGRSAGNAQTEILVYILQKMGISPINTEIYAFYDFANKFIAPLMPRSQGLTDEEIHIGISKFHSGYLPLANKIAAKYGIDRKKLIKWVSDVNCINPSEALFSEVAQKISKANG